MIESTKQAEMLTPRRAINASTALETPPNQAAEFDAVYRGAADVIRAVPWARGEPNPFMIAWLNAVAPGMIRPGSRVVVVGCGLGDDVAELCSRGYDAIGFDISPTAIEWAARRFPDRATQFHVADLFAPPTRFLGRFDLVIEVHTIQSLPPSMREVTATAIASLACPHGAVLTIARGRDDDEPLEEGAGPPWPLTVEELERAFAACGWSPTTSIDAFEDDGTPPKRRLRGVFVCG